MKRSFRTLMLLSLALMLVLTACSSGGNGKNEGGNKPDKENTGASDGKGASKDKVTIKIPHYKSGSNVGAKFFLPQVERFNKKYEGQYELIIEEIPQDDYNAKIKLLAQQKKLPALIEGGEKTFLEDVVIKDELFYDLKPWLDSKPEVKKLMIEDNVAYNTKGDKIFSMPLITMRPIGLYYNKEVFEKAGVTKPISQMTFAEFNEALEQIKSSGVAPLTLMTSENAWTSMLLATAFMANEPGGADVLKSTEYTYDYTAPAWINTFTQLQKWFQNYTTDNAIGAAYADAANNFLNERTAIIANGPWMVGDFSDTTKSAEGLEKKIGASIYPGGIAIATLNEYSWWIPKGLSEGETQAALAFLEFMAQPEEQEAYMVAEGGTAPNLQTSAEFESKLNPILAELNSSTKNDLKNTVQAMSSIFPNQIADPEFGKFLPTLINGDMTPEQFAQELTRKAKQFQK
ncbi:ABC transporter substrate-binding protein [Paenibacillus spongiae]|uniref:ABC transporter substrate-binding protein n=1 Tax=Paenibacillus spongiae TaxID=2909671 RepID=A0ABY5S5I6_9BACL|nr:ABC transporter substrate-binding protein [Paenibacillus spongiae]UVI29167.1 ABC transporter substrate-binding protein [Paenibacillus spongiae]